MSEPSKNIVGSNSAMKHREVDLSRKYTLIHLENYNQNSFTSSRVISNRRVIGYCAESPEFVLSEVFPKLVVTSFKGIELYAPNCFNYSSMKGISIEAVDPCFGIEGTVDRLLNLQELSSIIRSPSFSTNFEQSVMSIQSFVSREEIHEKLNPNYLQLKHDKETILNILSKFPLPF